MFNLSNKEKEIYNTYLKNSRKGQPFMARKDFTDMDQSLIVTIKKIGNILSKYNHIKTEDYFSAFNILHPDDRYPNIEYFTTLAAVKIYTLFKKQQEDTDPEKQTEEIKESFRFIGMFCLENKITLEKYSTHKTGYMLSWLNHYREHRINPYSLMELDGIFSSLQNLQKDEIELFAKNLNEKIVAYRSRYASSQKTKTLVREATKKIKDFVKNNLQ